MSDRVRQLTLSKFCLSYQCELHCYKFCSITESPHSYFSKAIICPPLTISFNGFVTHNILLLMKTAIILYAFYMRATYTGFFQVGNNSTTCTGNGITGALIMLRDSNSKTCNL